MEGGKIVLVTGGTGLVGKAIRRICHSLAPGCKWIFVGSFLDLQEDYMRVRNFFSIYQPTSVIHLAAKVGGMYLNERAKLDMFYHNMHINEHIIRACLEFQVERVVLCLSTCVYPDGIEYPFHEASLHSGPPHPSNEGYAYAKRMLELQARLLNERKAKTGQGPSFFCVIPTNIYGPDDNFSLEDGHVIPGLIHRCYLAVRDGTPFVVKGSGAAVRQFIHADDVARCILSVLFCKSTEIDQKIARHGVILAPAPEAEVSIAHLVETIAKAFALPNERILFDPSFSDGQLRKTASNQLLMECFPDCVSRFIDFDEGLRATVTWFAQNYQSHHFRK
jgi:GDP-L-fucose synthase